ncbi:MAG: tetratricopeptide repeat protein [Moorea sp. SIO3G5]|nr:tetratricopeptide repeat protein [Moorena sp. SIO3G5]
MSRSNLTKFRPDEQEYYLRLKRDLSWREGFGILFVRCTTVQEKLIFEEIKQDINDKTVEVLKLDHSIDNLYDLIEEKVNDNPIDILLISGMEKSLDLKDYIKHTIENPKKSYQREALASLLGHLNWQRERFRDDFNCCLVFTVRKYTLRYLVRRAPDFFDWRSGVIEFPVDRDIDLLDYYTPFQADIEQQKPQDVSQDQKDIVHTPEDYYDLLKKLLLLEYENNGDLQAIHDVVKSNADKLDSSFAKTLEQWILNNCYERNPEEKEAIAGIVESLCIDIYEYNLGKSANTIEIAITGLETVLQLPTRETLSQEWARTLHDLGGVYRNRIVGDKAENLEKALACYKQALTVRTFEAFPIDWAITQNNLGIAYRHRIKGDKSQNIEEAIACYQQALTVYTFDAFTEDWARTQNNLAIAYLLRIKGQKAQNIEEAIACYQQALTVYTFDAFTEDWAMMQTNLGNAYYYQIKGQKAQNIEKAIACYQEALRVYTFEAFPEKWAMTQYNLGSAYYYRIKGQKAQNIEKAITCYQEALTVYTFNAFPEYWADTQNNLSIAYRNRIKGQKAQNIEEAITCYQEALTVYTFEAFNCLISPNQRSESTEYSTCNCLCPRSSYSL